jgi:dihydrofolate synthase / folylpolyglutamate synthase
VILITSYQSPKWGKCDYSPEKKQEGYCFFYDKLPLMSSNKYAATIKKLQTYVLKRGINYSLDRFQTLLKDLGNPEKSFKKCIHVAGTNGKGSTIAFIKSVCLEMGLTVGTYTSPHISTYRERIQIDNTLISEEKFNSLFQVVTAKSNEASEFEILTAMAFLYFKELSPDIVLLETGLGGRLDTTNVVTPTCSIISKIGLDHQDILGETLLEIAGEKAGIIKKNVPVITISTQTPEVLKLLTKKANSLNSQIHITTPETEIPAHYTLQGNFQKENIALSKKTIYIVFNKYKNSHIIENGLSTASHWGRFTMIQKNNQKIILDAAHNVDAFSQLFKTLEDKKLLSKETAMIIGILKRKNIDDLSPFLNAFPGDLYYSPFSEHAHSFEALKKAIPSIKRYQDTLPKNNIVIITGSILFISQFAQAHT